ncbi:MAG: hypothetical protein GXY80_09125 [Syntrophorhabdus aromaticivorans]|uniref:Uncharacterized protein n=1 Tax=Syntrophorhabdus aromaticivorans TaxID=328301 RepID=A0A971M4J0_9BACT|nr:hypothetical protein [Syntrophorhabdus aromaticivorans]
MIKNTRCFAFFQPRNQTRRSFNVLFDAKTRITTKAWQKPYPGKPQGNTIRAMTPCVSPAPMRPPQRIAAHVMNSSLSIAM